MYRIPRPCALLVLSLVLFPVLAPVRAPAQGGIARIVGRAVEEAELAEGAAAAANAERIATSGRRTSGLVEEAEGTVNTASEAASGATLAERITGMRVQMLARSVPRVEEATVLVALHEGTLVTVSNVSRNGQAPRAYRWRREAFNLPSVVAEYEYESPTLWDRYEAMDRVMRSTRDSTRFVVDQHVFADPAMRDVDVSYASNVRMRDVTGVDRRLDEIWYRSRPFRAAEYGGPMMALAFDTVAPAVLSALQGNAFRREDAQVLALVPTPEMDGALGPLIADERVRFDGSGPEALVAAMRSAKRPLLFVLGYAAAANDTLWATDEYRRVTFPVSYAGLRRMAPAGVTIIPVGMNADELRWQSQPYGSLAVASRLVAALGATNQFDFYRTLSGNEVNFLLRPPGASPSGTRELRAISIRTDERGAWQGYPLGTIGLLPAPPPEGPGFWSRHPVLKWGGIAFLVLMVLNWLGGDAQAKPAKRRA